MPRPQFAALDCWSSAVMRHGGDWHFGKYDGYRMLERTDELAQRVRAVAATPPTGFLSYTPPLAALPAGCAVAPRPPAVSTATEDRFGKFKRESPRS